MVAVGLAVGLGAPSPVGAAGCDPHDPTTCTLRQLADQLGRRVGATAELGQLGPGPYADTLAREFNSVTPENAMKWYTVQPTPGGWNFAPADAVVDFAVAHTMEVRGHNLVWAQDQYTPGWVKAITDPTEMRTVVQQQVTTVVNRYKDRVHRWDVVNEPLESIGATPSDNVFRRVLGDGYLAEVFAMAHAADPTAELWLNEYGTDWVPGKHEALLAMVQSLLADGVPIHGVGIQTHRFSPNGPDPVLFQRQLQDFADLGLDVAITELDVATDPTSPTAFADQAAAYDRIVQACLAVTTCREVTTWGVTDASSWLDSLGLLPTPTRPLLFDDSFSPKPAYDAVRNALAATILAPPTTTTTAVSTTTTPAPSSTAAGSPNLTPGAAPAVTATPRFSG